MEVIVFTLLYEDNNGKIESRTSDNGEWRFIKCFDEIKEI